MRRGRSDGSGAVAAMSRGVGADRPQEVDLAEVRPDGLAEVELRVGALPEHEAGEALLSRRADDEIRVGLAAGVEMLGNVLNVEDLGEFLDAGAPARLFVQE